MAQSVKPVDTGVTIGEVFLGKYRVESILGQGGMGVVAECTHLALNERVAIKLLRQDVLLDQDAVQRFIREAQAAVKLKSEYVARVSDVGTFENGTPYMVMEYLEGHDLGELLKQRGVLPVQWAVELMLQTAEALCEAHSLGIVHRDVKPSNLFVTWRPDGTSLIKVLDFGISKSPMGTDMQLTQTQSLLGTPAYMSPEQMRSARLVDHRTDIWSLGTVFYEILEGRKPFQADSFSEMCVKVAVDPPETMHNTPPGLQQVILRSLAKSHEQRFANMAEFARELVPFAPDPHNAQMLVERMARMMKRSSFDWEGGSTGVGRQALATGPRERQTPVPRLESQWNVGSDPAASPWRSQSDPAMRAWHGNTPTPVPGSQPFAKQLEDVGPGAYAGPTVSETPRRSRVPLVVAGLFVLAAAGGAIAYVSQKQPPAGTAQLEALGEPSAGSEHHLVGSDAIGAAGSGASGSGVESQGLAGSAAAIMNPATEHAHKGSAGSAAAPSPTDGKAVKTTRPAGRDGAGSSGTKTHPAQTKTGSSQKSVKTTTATPPPTTTKPTDKATAKTGSGSAPVPEKVTPPQPKCDPFGARKGC